jgi:predicted nucleic acid-binding protein
MAMNIVLDTNAVLYFLGGRLVEPLPRARVSVSVITEIELLSYPTLAAEDESEIRSFLDHVDVIDLVSEIKRLAILLRREYRLKLPDAVIAATAHHLRAQLWTNDTKLLNIPLPTSKSLLLK